MLNVSAFIITTFLTTKTTTMSTTNMDQKVLDLFRAVQAKKETVAKASKPSWATSCEFGFTPSSAHDRTDIRKIKEPRKLVEMLAFLNERHDGYAKAAGELGVDVAFTWLGFSLSEWKEDLKTQTDILTLQAKRKELADLEAKLNTLLSPEQKRQLEFEALGDMAKSLLTDTSVTDNTEKA